MSFLKGVFAVFIYVGFNIRRSVAAYFNGVTTEQVTKLMMCGEVLSNKIQRLISDFCFDIGTRGSNKTTFRFLFRFLLLTFSFTRGNFRKFADPRIFLEVFCIFLLILSIWFRWFVG